MTHHSTVTTFRDPHGTRWEIIERLMVAPDRTLVTARPIGFDTPTLTVTLTDGPAGTVDARFERD